MGYVRPRNYVSKKAVCPFYLNERRQLIRCEGVVDRSVIYLTFASATDAKNYKIRHCRHNYHSCPIHAMLEEKYGRVQ